MGRRPLEERPAAGFGLPLLLVLCILLILGTVGFHQLFWASHVTAGASRGAWGELALRAAESAVEELKHRVELDASDPERRLFHELRQDVPAGADGSFEVADSARLDVLPALLAEEVTPEMSLEKCSASVAYQIPFEDLPFERFGMMRYSARVAASGPGVSWVVRDLEIAQGFKVVLASVPRPFDQAAVYVGDAWSAVDLAQVNRLRDRHVQMATAQLVDLERAAALAPPPLQSRYAEARSSVSSVPEVAARVPRLAESKPAMLLAVGVGGQEYPLDGLALDRKLAAQEALVRPLVEKAAAALATVQSDPANVTAHEAFLAALTDSLEGTQQLLNRVWAYGASYRILDDAAPEYAAIASQHARLGLTHWRRVAAWVVEEAGGQSVQARFDALVHRLGVVNGVVLVEPGAAPFVLRGNLPGKLVVAVHGGRLILDGTNLNDRPSDLLTVVALGSHVEVQGEVHASLVLASLPAGDRSGPPDPVVSFTADAVLRGGLVAERLGPGSVLAGSLLREEKYASGTAGAGALADRYVVLFSPTTVYRRVVNR